MLSEEVSENQGERDKLSQKLVSGDLIFQLDLSCFSCTYDT